MNRTSINQSQFRVDPGRVPIERISRRARFLRCRTSFLEKPGLHPRFCMVIPFHVMRRIIARPARHSVATAMTLRSNTTSAKPCSRRLPAPAPRAALGSDLQLADCLPIRRRRSARPWARRLRCPDHDAAPAMAGVNYPPQPAGARSVGPVRLRSYPPPDWTHFVAPPSDWRCAPGADRCR